MGTVDKEQEENPALGEAYWVEVMLTELLVNQPDSNPSVPSPVGDGQMCLGWPLYPVLPTLFKFRAYDYFFS